MFREQLRKPLFEFKSDATLAKEAHDLQVKSDPNRREENLIVDDAKRVLSILSNATGSGAQSAGLGASCYRWLKDRRLSDINEDEVYDEQE